MLAACTDALCRNGLKNTRGNWKKKDNKKKEDNNKCCCVKGKGNNKDNFHLVFQGVTVAEVGEAGGFLECLAILVVRGHCLVVVVVVGLVAEVVVGLAVEEVDLVVVVVVVVACLGEVVGEVGLVEEVARVVEVVLI
jgi:hypothetical protein